MVKEQKNAEKLKPAMKLEDQEWEKGRQGPRSGGSYIADGAKLIKQKAGKGKVSKPIPPASEGGK